MTMDHQIGYFTQMLPILTFTIFIGLKLAFADDACIENGKWAPSAANCDNEYTDESCRVLFPGTLPIIPGQPADRFIGCTNARNYEDNTYPNPSDTQRETAVWYCPNKCGYCCLTEAYKCENWEAPTDYNCNTPEALAACAAVTPTLCESSTENRQTYAKCCPQKCGFCTMNGCIDAMASCKNSPSICTFPSMANFVQQYCQRTCGLCEPCKYKPDSRNNCVFMKEQQGFCDNPNYPKLMIKRNCATTCKVC